MHHLPLWLTRVEHDSMVPCLRDGQLVWTIRSRPRHRLRRGAVVAVDSRELGRRIVKRVIGLPGEHLRLEDSELWVDGRRIAEPYAIPSRFRGAFDVPEEHYLLLGDNRVASNDSRAWRRPYVARTEIVGVLLQRNRGTHLRIHDAPGRTATDLADVARAATFGAVDVLLVDIDRVVPGHVDDDGQVTFTDEPGAYGVVDEVARRVLSTGGRVVAVRADEVPGGGEAAAILRYA